MTAIVSHSDRNTHLVRPLAWRDRFARSRQAPRQTAPLNARPCQPEAIVMKRPVELPSLKIFFSLILVAAGLWVITMLVPTILPNFGNPVSATDIAGNVFSARRSCMRADASAEDFAAFCEDNFVELNRAFYLKARNEIDVPGRSIAVNSEHPINRFFQISANADEMFGSSNQMLENRIAAFTHIECAVSDGQTKGLTGFGAIKWTFDPDVKPYCPTTIKIERIKN